MSDTNPHNEAPTEGAGAEEPLRRLADAPAERPLTRVGPDLDAPPPRRYLTWVVGGVALASAAVLVVSALVGRPRDPRDDVVDARNDLICTTHTDDAGNRRVECLPESSTTTVAIDPGVPVEGDEPVDGPVVTSPPVSHDPVGSGSLDGEAADCITAYFQERFTPEEFALYASGGDGPRSDEWLSTATAATESCVRH